MNRKFRKLANNHYSSNM